MKVIRRIVLPILILTILLINWGKAQAQSTDVQYFPETGHSIKGAFLQFYKSAKDPLLFYGYPITEQMTSKGGKTVQYFQRARFELNDQVVQLTPLGALTYKSNSPITIDNPNACEVHNNIPICFAFLKFYKANDGLSQFGYPVSPFESSNGLIVQYFEGARFEWRTDRPSNQRVVISDLGRIYFDQLKEDPAQLRPVEQLNAAINPVLSLHARAFVLKAVTLQDGQQTVHIVVQDQTLSPVPGANGNVLLNFPDGTSQKFTFTTNALGIAQITFNFNQQQSGSLIPIQINVQYEGLTAATRTSFRVWY